MIKLKDKLPSQDILELLITLNEKGASWDNLKKDERKRIREELGEICVSPKTPRCFYCEDGDASIIDHFQPQSLYPEHIFLWDNYQLVCFSCSNHKGSQFAVIDDNGVLHKLTKTTKQQFIGIFALINPRKENPHDFLELDFTTFYFEPIDRNQRGQYTLDILDFNERLESFRRRAFKDFLKWLDLYANAKSKTERDYLFEDLREKDHLSVWEEMCRVYRDRTELWDEIIREEAEMRDAIGQTEKTPYEKIDEAFKLLSEERLSEVLAITFIPQ